MHRRGARHGTPPGVRNGRYSPYEPHARRDDPDACGYSLRARQPTNPCPHTPFGGIDGGIADCEAHSDCGSNIVDVSEINLRGPSLIKAEPFLRAPHESTQGGM